MPNTPPLPNDVESLKQLVIEQRVLLASRDVLIEKLKIELLRLKRMQFGRSSEQLDTQIAQLEDLGILPKGKITVARAMTTEFLPKTAAK